MWDEMKQRQLDGLQRREAESVLTDEEKRSLEKLLFELEQDEWQKLNPALERLRGEQIRLQEETGQVKTQNAILSAIDSRQNDLLERADAQLKGLQSERKALQAERERVLKETVA